jgi:hypothetical protein
VDSPHVYWLTGQAGSGKSTIAYSIAQYFDDGGDEDEYFHSNADVALQHILGANFFCSRQFEETRLRRNIIPTIVYQLACQSRSYAKALLKAKKFDSVNIVARQMKDLLVDPWKQSTAARSAEMPCYLIIVDALDEIEANGGSAFLQELLNTVNKGHLQGLKFLITSRPDPELTALCSSFSSNAVCHLYEVPTDTIQADITKYLTVQLPKLDLSDVTKLVQKADGLFIYAATIVRYLTPRLKITKNEQLQLLAKLDNSSDLKNTSTLFLDILYQQVLWTAFAGLPDDLLGIRLKILHILLCTKEPVSVQIAERLLSDSDNVKDIGQLVVDELHSVLYVKNSQVFWYHASFQDFMFTQNRSMFKIPDIHKVIDMSCNATAQHAFLVESCFRIMKSDLQFNICKLPSSFLLDSEVSDLADRVKQYIGAGLKYSAQYWVQHLIEIQTSDKIEFILSSINDFLFLSVLFWIETMNLLKISRKCTWMLQQTCQWIIKV